MISKCPGQDNRNLKVGIISCPGCGFELEIFSDEMKISCPKCKNSVLRERLPSCIDWCKAAERCLGRERSRQLKTEEFSQNT